MIFLFAIALLITHAVINLAFGFTFFMKIDDYMFNEFKSQHKKAYFIVYILVLSVNFNLIRLFWAKIFRFTWTFSNATNPNDIFKILRFYSMLYIACIQAPLVLICPLILADRHAADDDFTYT